MSGSRCVLTWVTLGETLLVRFSRCICPCSGLRRCGAHNLNRRCLSLPTVCVLHDMLICYTTLSSACLPGATRTSQTAAVNKLMLIRIVTHPHRSSQRQASSTRANEFDPSCVRHSGRELGARISHPVVSTTTTTRQSRVFGDHRRQVCIGLRAATQQGSRVAHYSIRRQGRAEQVIR